MDVVLGLKTHSGWAAAVAVGMRAGESTIVDRRRIDLVHEPWQKQPYHAADNLGRQEARDLVERAILSARDAAVREIGQAIRREAARANRLVACAVLVSAPMPAWTVDEILAVHPRMHTAEGVLFKDAILEAAKTCGLAAHGIAEKSALAGPFVAKLAALGKSIGPPWGKDQKVAALAALTVLMK